MTSRQPGAGPESTGPPGTSEHYWVRLLPLALLIVLGLAGLRGAVGTPRWDGPLHRDGIAVGLALEAVFAVLAVLTLRRQRSAQSGAGRAQAAGGDPDRARRGRGGRGGGHARWA